MNDTVLAFLDEIERLHNQNAQLKYFARSSDQDDERSTNPLTSFVFELFLYNSLYQIDWRVTLDPNGFVYHNRENVGEEAQQDLLEEFIFGRDSTGTNFKSAFEPFKEFELTGNWTTVLPDRSITIKHGNSFFGDLRSIQAATMNKIPNVETLYSQIRKTRLFIYKVRCNIFHGSKTLGEVDDPDQKKRIQVYFTFLHCLLTLFFIVVRQEGPDEGKLS